MRPATPCVQITSRAQRRMRSGSPHHSSHPVTTPATSHRSHRPIATPRSWRFGLPQVEISADLRITASSAICCQQSHILRWPAHTPLTRRSHGRSRPRCAGRWHRPTPKEVPAVRPQSMVLVGLGTLEVWLPEPCIHLRSNSSPQQGAHMQEGHPTVNPGAHLASARQLRADSVAGKGSARPWRCQQGYSESRTPGKCSGTQPHSGQSRWSCTIHKVKPDSPTLMARSAGHRAPAAAKTWSVRAMRIPVAP